MFLQTVLAFWKQEKRGSITLFHSTVNRIIKCGGDRKIAVKNLRAFS